MPYFFVYCDANKKEGLFSTALTVRSIRATIQTLRGAAANAAFHGSVFYTTICLTTTAFEGRGNSGEKGAVKIYAQIYLQAPAE